jgi:translation elongation factor EF-Tu-like GTPase
MRQSQRASVPEVYVLTKDEGGRHTPFFIVTQIMQ